MKRLFAALAMATFVSAACGSSDDGNLNHQTCTPGDTRTCVGPGACNGGQVCGSDGNWGTCDCGGGGSGGSAGVGGSAAGASGATVDGSADTGIAGTAGTAGSGGLGGAGMSGSAGSAGGGTGGVAGAAQDDPCPAAPIAVNCTDQCGGPTGLCTGSQYANLTCRDDISGAFTIHKADLPLILRTPHAPGAEPLCQHCGADSAAWQALIQTSIVFTPNVALRVRVGPPWRVRITYPPGVCMAGSTEGCLVTTAVSGDTQFQILTDDPNAPSRNAYIELVPATTTCP